ncbi:MAG: leucine-rich repeat domain-containing protein [Clostridia bacterium]|nr:leucine-rich repeat domain-containing protein [Clostridia bacterium]
MKNKLLKLLAVIFCGATLALGITACGEKDKMDNVVEVAKSVFIVKDGEITGLTREGKQLSELHIPTKIGKITITDIAAGAFKDCSNLTSVILPDGLKTIAPSMFAGCSNLTSIHIPDSVTFIGRSVFEDCSSLKNITISDSVTFIGDSAFKGCSSLSEMRLPFVGVEKNATYYDTYFGSIFGGTSSKDSNDYVPASLKTVTIAGGVIAANAFIGCRNLTSVKLLDGVTEIGASAFAGCSSLTSIDVPDNVTSIGGSAFKGCSSLSEMRLPFVGAAKNAIYDTYFGYIFGGTSSTHGNDYVPESLKAVTITGGAIAENAFKDCGSLTSIDIPAGVTSIGKSTFLNCSSLTSIDIPAGVTSIDKFAFSHCSSLTNIVIPAGVTSIGDNVFSYCSSLTGIQIIDGVTSIGQYAFYECISLKNILLPDNLTSIGRYAFYNCDSLTNIVIPNGVTSIGQDVFYGCISLTSIRLSDNLTSIGAWAFYNCDSLTNIIIPNGVTSIASSAFAYCDSLTIYCERASKPMIGWDLDWNDSDCPVYWYSETQPTTDGNYWHYVNGAPTVWE